MTTAEYAARYLLHLAATDREPSPITQMHLHKLLYFAQGWSLAVNERPLFEAGFEAWPHGPGLPELRPTFKQFGRTAISEDNADERGVTDLEDRLLLETIWRHYRRYSASGLRSLSHRQAPWADARRGESAEAGGRAVISVDAIRAFFDLEYVKSCRRRGIDPEALRQARADVRAGRTIPWDEAVRGWRETKAET